MSEDRGRPRIEMPEDAAERIQKMAAEGATQRVIGYAFGMSERTLRRRLSEDDDLQGAYYAGRAEYLQAAETRFRDIAMGRPCTVIYTDEGDPVEVAFPTSEQYKALRYILATQGGWTEEQHHVLKGDEAEPIRFIETRAPEGADVDA